MLERVNEPRSAAILMRWRLDGELFRNTFLSRGIPRVDISTNDPIDFEKFCMDSPVSVALIDIGIPNQVGVNLGRRLIANRSASHVLFLDREYGKYREITATAMGAKYCSREISLPQLATVVAQLTETGTLDEYAINLLAPKENLTRFDLAHEPRLSGRELDVWTLIAEGLSVADCAKRLGISQSTADNHKSRLMKKLKVNKSLELVRMAIKHGLVEL